MKMAPDVLSYGSNKLSQLQYLCSILMNDTENLFPVEQLALITCIRTVFEDLDDINEILQETPIMKIVSLCLDLKTDNKNSVQPGCSFSVTEIFHFMKLESLWIILNLFIGD